jgi:prepilin-type N-terminal cleavage/methylation domain-containing protein
MIRKNKGFTLIELMVVIVIMGVLAVLAIPKLTDVITKAKVGEVPIVLGTWEHAVVAHHAESGTLPSALTDLVFEAPTSKWFGYTFGGGGVASATYTTSILTGKKVGALTGGPVSTITTDAAISHTVATDWAKYLPNF